MWIGKKPNYEAGENNEPLPCLNAADSPMPNGNEEKRRIQVRAIDKARIGGVEPNV